MIVIMSTQCYGRDDDGGDGNYSYHMNHMILTYQSSLSFVVILLHCLYLIIIPVFGVSKQGTPWTFSLDNSSMLDATVWNLSISSQGSSFH